MSGVKISTDAPGFKDAFHRAANAGIDVSSMLKEIGGALRSATVDRFTRETEPNGAKWKPLSPRTVKRKKSSKILVKNEVLRKSINAQVSGFVLEVGTPVRYAAIHQFGGSIDRAARTQTIYQSAAGVRSGDFKRMRFAKAKRATFAREVNVGAHKIIIPARPFLDISLTYDRPLVTEIIDRRIRYALALDQGGDL